MRKDGAIFHVAAILIISTTQAVAQSCTTVIDGARNGMPALIVDGRPVAIEPAFEDYAFMLEDACGAWSLTTGEGCMIFPMMGDIGWNAVATVCDGNQIIVYDRRLSLEVGYEGAQAVISHELGHHFCGHLREGVTGTARNHEIELEADRFAGATMHLLEFSRQQVLSYQSLLSELPAQGHPGRDARTQALLEGWDDPQSALACLNQ